jgi:phage terminase large subunit-like protein
MPWQREAARLAGALTADGSSMLFPYVVLHVPRRAGKSLLTLAALTHRLATRRHGRTWYTAQTRNDAALTFRDSWSPLVKGSPLYPKVLGLRSSNGSEQVKFLPTVGSLSLFAPGPTALHGQDSDAACVDEAWSFTLDAGGTLEAGIQPAQLTRPHRQLWIVSAGGTHASAGREPPASRSSTTAPSPATT